jgi:inhibitor of KinA
MSCTQEITGFHYEVYPLGDAAACIDFGNVIDRSINTQVQRLFRLLLKEAPAGILDIVPAYSSLAVFYVPSAIPLSPANETAFSVVAGWLKTAFLSIEYQPQPPTRVLRIPVCYDDEFAPDLADAAIRCGLDKESFIRMHRERSYHVYMIGFLPGFPYMGDVDERIAVPRKSEPRLSVAAGSVGIAGRQTGIYPFDSPGGWQIIARTPLPLFHAGDDPPTTFQPGDTVSFYPITINEYHDHQGRHL